MESSVVALEYKMSDKVDRAEVKQLIDEAIDNKMKDVQNAVSEDVIDSKIEELRLSEARQANVVIFHCTESKEDDALLNKENDIRQIRDLCKFMEVPSESVRYVQRLGKKYTPERPALGGDNISTSESQPERSIPLKVVFEDVKAKTNFMGSAKKLANAPDNMRKLSISHDMTQRERVANKLRIEEARTLNTDNPSGDWTYVVRGPSWGRRVVKVKKMY
jgi:hypothetical protein